MAEVGGSMTKEPKTTKDWSGTDIMELPELDPEEKMNRELMVKLMMENAKLFRKKEMGEPYTAERIDEIESEMIGIALKCKHRIKSSEFAGHKMCNVCFSNFAPEPHPFEKQKTNPHNWITRIRPGEDYWECNYCHQKGTFQHLQILICDYVYPLCKFCGQSPICAPDCPGIMNIIATSRGVEFYSIRWVK